jgi:hypothetical protein
VTAQASPPPTEPFSTELERWLRSDEPKTLGELTTVFAERSFAVAILLLMFVPALPLPTGGVTHVFEAIVIVLGLQMVLGRRMAWLPKRWQARPLGATTTERAIPYMLKWIRRVERISRPRAARVFEQGWMLRLCGLLFVGLAVAAAVAPPFSGLDTLPSMGAIAIALSIILGDIVIFAIGVALGAIGVLLIVTIGATLLHFVRSHI